MPSQLDQTHLPLRSLKPVSLLLALGWLALVLFLLIGPARHSRAGALPAFSLWVVHLALVFAAWRTPIRVSAYARLASGSTPHLLFRLGLFGAGALLSGYSLVYVQHYQPGRVMDLLAENTQAILATVYAIFWECLALLGFSLILRFGWRGSIPSGERRTMILTGALLMTAALVWVGMAISGAGLQPDVVGWGQPGVPVLFYQFLAACLGALAIWAIERAAVGRQWNRRTRAGLETAIVVVIWASAAAIWARQPILNSHFAPPGRAPNYEVYPYSDAGLYDSIAQSLLIGEGFLGGRVVPRPLYISFLAFAHLLVGQGYPQVIFVQTLVLAAFPVFLYLLGKELHSWSLGLMLAILAILREVNTIFSTPVADVSSSKQLLSDLPMALAVSALAWLLVRWLKAAPKISILALIAGGVLGIAALLRAQVLLAAPLVILAAAWSYRRAWQAMVQSLLLFGLGFGLVFSPWLVRNWLKTGQLVLDDPLTQTGMIAARYNLQPQDTPPRLPGESTGDYAARLSQSVSDFVRQHPGEAARFVTNHFLNNLVSTILVLPTRPSLASLCGAWRLCEPFWVHWPGGLGLYDLIWVALNLGLFSLGLAAAWVRWGVAGLVPAFIHLAYNLSNAIARNSARRYILPVDWIGYVYYGLGLIELACFVVHGLGASKSGFQEQASPVQPGGAANVPERLSARGIAASSAVFLLMGLWLPLAEALIPPRYPQPEKSAVVERLLALPAAQPQLNNLDGLQAFIKLDNVVALEGRALYPRFYPPGEGEPGSGWRAYKPYEDRKSGKLGFVLVSPSGMEMAGIAKNLSPDYFPNGADVIVLGCREQSFIDVLILAFEDNSGKLIVSQRKSELGCPLK